MTHEEIFALVDALRDEAPADGVEFAEQLAADLKAIEMECRDARETERPGGGR
jgi:hypothetical protein